MAESFKLKLLTGPLAGRELPLPHGVFRLGGDDADIAVPLDDNVTTALMIDDRGVRLGAPVPLWIDGRPETVDDCLPLDRALDVAGFGFALGRETDLIATRELVPRNACVPVPPWSAVRPAPSMPKRFLPGRVGRVAVAAGVTCVIGAATVAQWPVTAKVPAPTPAAQLAALVDRVGATARIDASLQSDTSVLIHGDCTDARALSALRAGVRAMGLAIRDETECRASALEAVQTTLRMHGYRDVTVNMAADDAKVTISGPIDADDRWRRAARALDDMKLRGGWHVSNSIASELETLAALLARHRQLPGVGAMRVGGTWVVTAQLSSARRRAVQALLDEFNADQPPHARARFDQLPNRPVTGGDAWLPASVASVGGDVRAPYATLTDGTRLTVGTQLPRGLRVLAIGREGVSLLRSDRLIHVPLAS
ncbi:EscD/YscD/HrpQ family type III secretion system inner membrane ring protein [Pandoraea terrae]|uniref:EscD/YscD/HrpQ family type III secretion system inner membrane ring protein n=1 Tax=Pandoraea terrae TaxID=1537710 RepID=A0A5E4ZG68_9BURK|nr:type III secretion system inner membrane ring subunit SctD [Pandoraea terrae]VVE59173.1 EscD/YscD/HrpQ family type III secretion system inner membrane ring protein [Pandoraea terrae]